MKTKLAAIAIGLFLLTSCAGFDAALDIADIIAGDPVIHTGVVKSCTSELDATIDPPQEVTVVEFDDGYIARLPGHASSVPGEVYDLRQSDTRGYYLDQ